MGGGDQGQGGRRDQRGAHALDGARAQQRGPAGRQPAGQRRDGEQDQAADEGAPASHPVGQPPGGDQAAAEDQRVGGDHPPERGGGEPEVGLHGGQRDGDDGDVEDDDELGNAGEGDDHVDEATREVLPSNMQIRETGVARPATAASMRLDGGHPALDLVNTVYGQPDGPVEADVLAAPEDLVTFARRLGMADQATRASSGALRAALRLRDALDAVLRARLAGAEPPAGPRAVVEAAARAALAAAQLAPHGDALAWTWPTGDPQTPVHRLSHAAIELLTTEAHLAVLQCCAGCRWLFLDHSRGPGRRWCSMADCGTEAKKRRYVQRRRERRAAGGG
jgi:predicted RNA-binding Zn ribbon-like protein